MLIANPIYDVIFKYLLEDIDIARELLSTILEEEIVSLNIRPQETSVEHRAIEVSVMRYDFNAVIKLKSGDFKKVLIELQKVKRAFDITRFRRYLGENYRKQEAVVDALGETKKVSLPIITIYFLGFKLDNIVNAVVKIKRDYYDAVTNEILEVKERFVELLTHDCYLIQIPFLKASTRSKLERLLQVFSPDFKTSDEHQLNFTGDIEEDATLKKIILRLTRAIASEQVRLEMDVEDEINDIFENGYSELRTAIVEKDKQLDAERQKAEAERQKAEAERQKVEMLLQEIENLKKQLKN